MTFLMENLSTVIIGLILAGVVYLVVRKMIRDRREGKGCGCSGGCAGETRRRWRSLYGAIIPAYSDIASGTHRTGRRRRTRRRRPF